MDKVFPTNMNPIPENQKEAIKVLEEYIRYMKEQIEYAIQIITKMNDGTSFADLGTRMSKAESNIISIDNRVVQHNTQIAAAQGDINALEDKVVTDGETPDDQTEGTPGKMIYDGYNVYICTNDESPFNWVQL